MFKKESYKSISNVWFVHGEIQPDTLMKIRMGIKWATVYSPSGYKYGKILRSAVKDKFIKC